MDIPVPNAQSESEPTSKTAVETFLKCHSRIKKMMITAAANEVIIRGICIFTISPSPPISTPTFSVLAISRTFCK